MKNVYNQDLEKRCEEMTESLVEFYMAEIKLNSADLDTKNKGILINNLILNTFSYLISDLSLLTNLIPSNLYKKAGFNKAIIKRLNDYDRQHSERFAKNES